ncbi:MAG: hypothetical protein Q8L27_02710 [archaeon]|nr:hypothetical protein [archaeon]
MADNNLELTREEFLEAVNSVKNLITTVNDMKDSVDAAVTGSYKNVEDAINALGSERGLVEIHLQAFGEAHTETQETIKGLNENNKEMRDFVTNYYTKLDSLKENVGKALGTQRAYIQKAFEENSEKCQAQFSDSLEHILTTANTVDGNIDGFKGTLNSLNGEVKNAMSESVKMLNHIYSEYATTQKGTIDLMNSIVQQGDATVKAFEEKIATDSEARSKKDMLIIEIVKTANKEYLRIAEEIVAKQEEGIKKIEGVLLPLKRLEESILDFNSNVPDFKNGVFYLKKFTDEMRGIADENRRKADEYTHLVSEARNIVNEIGGVSGKVLEIHQQAGVAVTGSYSRIAASLESQRGNAEQFMQTAEQYAKEGRDATINYCNEEIKHLEEEKARTLKTLKWGKRAIAGGLAGVALFAAIGLASIGSNKQEEIYSNVNLKEIGCETRQYYNATDVEKIYCDPKAENSRIMYIHDRNNDGMADYVIIKDEQLVIGMDRYDTNGKARPKLFKKADSILANSDKKLDKLLKK